MTPQDALAEAGIEFIESGHQHARAGWLQVRDCPFCGSTKYHLGFNLAAGFWNCWRCGFHPGWTVCKTLGLSREAARAFKQNLGAEAAREKVHGTLKEPPGRGPLLRAHADYLRGRGLDPEEVARLWQVEGIGIAARLSWRLYIPIARRGTRVSWTTRAIGADVKQRYISASSSEEAVSHRDVCYGLDYVRDVAVVVEGPGDAWRLGPGAVALFGIDYSAAQVRALAQVPRRIICFDNERPAQAQARKLAGELSCLPGSTGIVTLDAEDPGSASERDVRRLRAAVGLP